MQPWDWAYYAAQVKADRYAVDGAALRPYFSLDRVLDDGVFHAAHRLYGLSFVEREDLPDVRPGRAHLRGPRRRRAGQPALGLFVCDWFARPTKRGGAWMDEFVDPVAPARRSVRWWWSASTCPSPPPASLP